jgi:hypothetical protein
MDWPGDMRPSSLETSKKKVLCQSWLLANQANARIGNSMGRGGRLEVEESIGAADGGRASGTLTTNVVPLTWLSSTAGTSPSDPSGASSEHRICTVAYQVVREMLQASAITRTKNTCTHRLTHCCWVALCSNHRVQVITIYLSRGPERRC